MKLLVKISGVVLALIISTTSLLSQEISLGIGLDDILDSNRRGSDGSVLATSAVALASKVKFDSALNNDNLLFMPTINFQIDSKEDFFVGAGFTTRFTSPKFVPYFLDVGLTAGLFTENSTDSGIKNDLKFQSYVGLGYELDDRSIIILSIDHMLNKDLKNYNPGSEAILLNYAINLE